MRPSVLAGARAAALSAIAVAAVAIGACREPTEIVVAVTTDLPCSRLESTQIAVGRTGEVDGKPPASVSTQCIDGKIGTLVVVPSGSDDEEVALRVVTGVGKSAEQCATGNFTGGCIVARRALRFTPHTTLRVPVAMRASCIDVPCSGSAFETCVKGACVSGKLEPSACTGDGCDEGKLAPGAGPVPDGGDGTDAASDGGLEDVASNDAHVDANVGDSGFDAGPSTGGGTWTKLATPPIEARSYAYGVWTGSEVLVFGGETQTSFAKDGAHFDPKTNTWTAVMPEYSLPNIHNGASVVWADNVKQVILWGGSDGSSTFANGQRFDPASDNWIAMADPPTSVKGRNDAATAWTGTEMIVWGGYNETAGSLADGAAYNPSTNTWRTLPASPLSIRTQATAVWDGKSVRVYGGFCDGFFCTDGASYTPDSQGGPGTWSAVFTPPIGGRPFSESAVVPRGAQSALSIFFGGGNYWNDLGTSNGFTFDPDATTPITQILSPASQILPLRDRIDTFTWFGRGRLWTFAGLAYDGVAKKWVTRGEGASWDLATGQWLAMPGPPTAGPTALRHGGTTLWLGDRAFLYGGVTPAPGDGGGDNELGDGWLFSPN